jgi:hypothetical protein
MTADTVSYALFQSLCRQRSVDCRPIPVGERKTPDFEVVLGKTRVWVEVKQLDPTEDDKRISAAFDAGSDTDGTVAPSQRVREQIASGYRQLKSAALTGETCMLVIYNNSGFHNYIDSFTVSTAMFGRFGVRLAAPVHPQDRIRAIGQGFMGNSRVNRNHCKRLSVVAVLNDGARGEPTLDAYHNPFTTAPLDPDVLRQMATRQFRHRNPHGGPIVSWEPEQLGA